MGEEKGDGNGRQWDRGGGQSGSISGKKAVTVSRDTTVGTMVVCQKKGENGGG